MPVFCFYVARYLTLLFLVFLVVCAFDHRATKHCAKIYRIQVCAFARILHRWLTCFRQDYVPVFIFLCCNFKLAQRCSSLFYSPRPIFYGLLGLSGIQAVVQCVCSLKNEGKLPLIGVDVALTVV